MFKVVARVYVFQVREVCASSLKCAPLNPFELCCSRTRNFSLHRSFRAPPKRTHTHTDPLGTPKTEPPQEKASREDIARLDGRISLASGWSGARHQGC